MTFLVFPLYNVSALFPVLTLTAAPERGRRGHHPHPHPGPEGTPGRRAGREAARTCPPVSCPSQRQLWQWIDGTVYLYKAWSGKAAAGDQHCMGISASDGEFCRAQRACLAPHPRPWSRPLLFSRGQWPRRKPVFGFVALIFFIRPLTFFRKCVYV